MPPKASSTILDSIRRLSAQEFEAFVAEVYRREGYLVEQTGQGRSDAGYDLILLRETSVLVQCKHWLVKQIGTTPVRALAGAMHNVGATGGVCITTGNFTKPAREFAISMAIELVDGEALIRRFSKGIRKAA
jgi:restriction system protein